MPTEMEFINYKEFVEGLLPTENPDVTDKVVVSNRTDGPRVVPANTSALSNVATVSDVVAGNTMELQTSELKKKLDVGTLLRATAQNAVDSGVAALNYDTIVLTDGRNWVDGAVDASTGELDPTITDRITTKMLPFELDETLSVNAKTGVSFTFTLYCYDEYGNYLGYKSGTRSIAAAVEDFPAAKLFRFGLLSISGVSPTSASNIANIITSTSNPHILKFSFSTAYNPLTRSYVDNKIKSELDGFLTVNVDLNNSSEWLNGGTDTTTGIIDPSKTNRLSTKMFQFVGGEISVTPRSGVAFSNNVYCYDAEQTYLGLVLQTSSITDALTAYPTSKFFRLGLVNISGVSPISANNIANIATFGNAYAYKFELSDGFNEILNKTVDKKIEDASELFVNLNSSDSWLNGGTDTTTGIIDPSKTNRLSTKMFQFKDDVILGYTKPSGVSWIANLYCYDKSKKYLGMAARTNSIADALSSYPTAVWFRFGLVNIDGVSPINAGNIANIVSFSASYPVKRYTTVPEFEALESSDKLYGKLWYACGDSFTEGVVNDSTIPSGKYAGQKQVYPYFIGNRTGMDVVNIAVSGSTITYISGTSTASNCFTYPSTGKLYTIPANAEYITLKFGINDSHKNVPIGTIDDDANATLYGAWNVAVSYLLNKCPFAKIGIIVTNGCDSPEYSQAGKDIAKKWGIAYLDENFGYEVPLLHRVNGKPLVCAEAHQNRLENFRVSVDNTHPNAKAHEFESTFVEAWLRTL